MSLVAMMTTAVQLVHRAGVLLNNIERWEVKGVELHDAAGAEYRALQRDIEALMAGEAALLLGDDAADGLLADGPFQSELQANQRLDNRGFDNNYPDLRKVTPSSEMVVVPILAGTFAVVDHIPEDGILMEEIDRGLPDGDGDYMTGSPSISMQVDGKVTYLTWAEAYSLGKALCGAADVGFYG